MSDSWEVCPECSCGRNEDHKQGCSIARKPVPVIHGRGTPLEDIEPGRLEDGDRDVVVARVNAANAMRRYRRT